VSRDSAPVLILGCGYTGRRLARELLRHGASVLATAREPEQLDDLARLGASVRRLDVLEPGTWTWLEDVADGALVLHSIPVVGAGAGWVDRTAEILAPLAGQARRIAYLSTTAVYGDARNVNATTTPAPRTEPDRLRLVAESAVADGPWSWLILRPAAIYGPGRGVHHAMRKGSHRLAGDGENIASRIHVDDLVQIAGAALESTLAGAFPVADSQPCTAREMADFCAELLKLPTPPPSAAAGEAGTRSVDRRVDGSAICRALGITLRYPSYRTGVPAALAAESMEG